MDDSLGQIRSDQIGLDNLCIGQHLTQVKITCIHLAQFQMKRSTIMHSSKCLIHRRTWGKDAGI